MKHKSVKATCTATIAIIAIVLFAQIPAFAQDISERSGIRAAQTEDDDGGGRTRALVGVWTTAVTLLNCQTGLPVGVPPIRGLFTFHQDGTMSEFGVGPGQTPAFRSPGHGLWRSEHRQDYSFTFIHRRYDATGAFIGSQVIRATLEFGVSDDEFTAISATQTLNSNDEVIGNGCAASVGKRFK